MAVDDLIYLVYLANTNDDSATFAVFTLCNRRVDDRHEIRAPRLVSLEKYNTAFYTLDKPLKVITDKLQFWAWLDGRSGWAAFRPGVAAQLIPHWLGEYQCTKFQLGAIEFVESSCLADLATSSVSDSATGALEFELAGPNRDSGAFDWFMDLTGNLVASRRNVAGKQAAPGTSSGPEAS